MAIKEFMKNSVVDFDQFGNSTNEDYIYEGNAYSLEDYTSFNFRNIEQLVSGMSDDMFKWITVQDDDKIEKISYDQYGTTKYWDILVLINRRNPLFDMAYNYDILSETIDNNIQYYNDNISELTTRRKTALTKYYMSELESLNDSFRFVKVVKPEKIGEFIKIAYAEGYFK